VVLVNGEAVTGMDERQLRQLRRHKMSMVFQRFGLFSHRRVLDNIAYGLEVQGMAKAPRLARAREILDLVELTGWENYYPHELSGGMQQRVGLARALAVDPEILLCDEPFSALDPLIRRDMQNELLRLQKSVRKTIVFITHDFLEAIRIGDRIAVMKDGELVQVGTPEQLVAHPVNDYVREFTRDVPRVKVLTARSVMRPVHAKDLLIGHAIAIDTTLEALIPLTVDNEAGLAVVDERAELVGFVDRRAVMLALAERSAGS
jgi:glycine betaine/proline transport system ATP-binding protein